MKNVGVLDQWFRAILGIGLVGVGLWYLDGIKGNWLGIAVSVTSLLPFYMAITRSCFVFRWINIHSLSDSDLKRFGNPCRSRQP
jgi:hypothetical protein